MGQLRLPAVLVTKYIVVVHFGVSKLLILPLLPTILISLGLINHLDYIKNMGFTAVIITS